MVGGGGVGRQGACLWGQHVWRREAGGSYASEASSGTWMDIANNILV